MAELITCTALVAFTRYVSGHGMVHGDPDSTLKAAKKPQVPPHAVQSLVDEGLIKAPKSFFDEIAAAAQDDQDAVEAEELEKRKQAEMAANRLLPLGELSEEQLALIAVDEGVALAEGATAADMIAAIEAKRAEDAPPA